MPSIEILDSGRIDERESAFPQAVQLPNGDILCSFNVGGGAHVTGRHRLGALDGRRQDVERRGHDSPTGGQRDQRPEAEHLGGREDRLRVRLAELPRGGRQIRRGTQRADILHFDGRRAHVVRADGRSDEGVLAAGDFARSAGPPVRTAAGPGRYAGVAGHARQAGYCGGVGRRRADVAASHNGLRRPRRCPWLLRAEAGGARAGPAHLYVLDHRHGRRHGHRRPLHDLPRRRSDVEQAEADGHQWGRP